MEPVFRWNSLPEFRVLVAEAAKHAACEPTFERAINDLKMDQPHKPYPLIVCHRNVADRPRLVHPNKWHKSSFPQTLRAHGYGSLLRDSARWLAGEMHTTCAPPKEFGFNVHDLSVSAPVMQNNDLLVLR